MGIKREEEQPFSAPPWIVTFSDMIGLLTSFFIMLLTYSTKSKADFQKLAGALQGEFGLIADSKDNDFQSLIPPKDLLSDKYGQSGLKAERPELEKLKEQGKVLVRKPATGERVELEQMSDNMRVKLVTHTTFAPGSTRLTDDDRQVLKEVADLLRLTKHRFIIVGNAWDEGDATRTPGDLVTLSQQRALEVALYLESVAHIARNRFGVGGVGASQPLEISHAPDAAEANRRVEIILFPEG
jgi:chemotaxis protein MotB